MVDILLVTHAGNAQSLIHAINRIFLSVSHLFYIDFKENFDASMMEDSVSHIVEEIVHNKQHGNCKDIVFSTDSFGSSPYNICKSFARKYDNTSVGLHMITSVNLPMLVSLVTYRNRLDTAQLLRKATEDTKKSIRCESF